MPDMRYLDARGKFLKYAYDVLEPYFADFEGLERLFDAIPTDEEKNRFLKISSFYKFLIVDGRYCLYDNYAPTYVDYLDETYKFIALFALIEALYADDDYEEFFIWLMRKQKDAVFPIADRVKLQELYTQYKQVHGLTQKAIRFFNSFDEEDKEFLRQHITVKDHEPPIDALARSLYQMRSEFVHFARLIAELSPGTIFSTRQGKLMIIGLDLRGLSRLFEHGCLRHFGYVAAFPSPGT